MAQGDEKLICPLGFQFQGMYKCGREECAWWHGLVEDCAVKVVLLALPPHLGELNSHLADLVDLAKGGLFRAARRPAP